jgi:hypothetical protein
MAIQLFKDIIETKGYRIESRDREVFERGDLQTFFGFSDNDAIEIIIYDANDNQLPQANFGLVRYIPLTTENIRDYFLIADGTVFQMYNFPKEYFIDVETIIKEAGYDNGIFKTQITLINHRVGSNKKYDKLWIGEISPSRTEVRLLPLRRPETDGTDLFERYNIFLRDGEFREDTITYAINLIEEINPSLISTFIKEKYSENWYNKLKSEFNIQNFEAFCTTIHKKFVESALYEFTNRISDPKDLNYGKPKNTKPLLELSKTTIKGLCSSLMTRAIDYYLSTPVIRLAADGNITTDESMDIVTQVRQTKESDTIIDTTQPELKLIERKKAVVKDTDLILEDLKKIELPPPPPDIIYLPGFEEPPMEFIRPELPIDIIEPAITITETTIPVSGGGRGGGGGGAGERFERDFGSGFGREVVVGGDLTDRQNIQ